VLVPRRALHSAGRGHHCVKQGGLRRPPRALFPIVKLIRGIERIRNARLFQLAGHKTGEGERRRRRRGFHRLRCRPAANPTDMTGFLLPAAGAVNALANRRFFRRRAGGPRVFAVRAQRPPRKNVPLRQHIVAALRRQFQYGEIFRHGAETRRNENHPLRINTVNGFDHVAIQTVELLRVVIELVGRLVNQIKPE